MPWEFSAEVQRRVGFDRLPASPGDVTDFITRTTSFEQLASLRAERVNLTGGGDPERVGGVRVSRNFLTTLGVQPVHGRDFAESDAAAPRVILIGYGLWQRRYGGATTSWAARFRQRRTGDHRRRHAPVVPLSRRRRDADRARATRRSPRSGASTC